MLLQVGRAYEPMHTENFFYVPTTRVSRTRVYGAVDAQKADCCICVDTNVREKCDQNSSVHSVLRFRTKLGGLRATTGFLNRY